METQRIGYIDAMRGLTMILVVYSHICGFCLGNWGMAGNGVLMLFRLPCFFFISGWLFEKVGRVWDKNNIKTTVRHKFMVQIVPTFIFLLLLAPPPELFIRLGAMKGGYWFTFVLFEFFLLCIFSEKFLRGWGRGLFAILVSLAAFLYDVYYNCFFVHTGWLKNILGFLSFSPWRFFLFFYIGTIVKRHIGRFEKLTSHPLVLVLLLCLFAAVAAIPHTENPFMEYLVFVVAGILGMTAVFTFFRLYYQCFSVVLFPLRFVGTRTLDIYLLHYFFLPRFLVPWGTAVGLWPSVLASSAILGISLFVVGLCLLTSYVIRLSPFLAHYLFGAKR